MNNPLAYLPTLFQQTQLSKEEELQSKVLNPIQRIGLLNQASTLVREIVQLTYDSKDTEGYALALVYRQGQLDCIQFQINQSDDAVVELNRELYGFPKDQPDSAI